MSLARVSAVWRPHSPGDGHAFVVETVVDGQWQAVFGSPDFETRRDGNHWARLRGLRLIEK